MIDPAIFDEAFFAGKDEHPAIVDPTAIEWTYEGGGLLIDVRPDGQVVIISEREGQPTRCHCLNRVEVAALKALLS